jgi:hypothetical protein
MQGQHAHKEAEEVKNTDDRDDMEPEEPGNMK